MLVTTPPIRILAVDDHPMLRDGLAAMIATQPDLTLVAEAGTGKDAILQFRKFRPDITLMDLRLPDMSGVDVIASIASEFPGARIIVLTTYLGDVQATRAIQAGAQGYLLKETIRLDLLDAIRAVHSGRRRIPDAVTSEIAKHAADDLLSQREIQVLQHVAAGNSNKVIAGLLGITEVTVKTHMGSILSKLGAKDRTHAVMIGMKRGFLA